MLLCDTGVLLAAGNMKDHHHAACLALVRAAEGPLLVPSPVLGEIGYLLQSRVGPHAEVTFLKSFGGNGFHVAEVEEGDISRIAELVEQYVGLPPRHRRCSHDRDRRAPKPRRGRDSGPQALQHCPPKACLRVQAPPRSTLKAPTHYAAFELLPARQPPNRPIIVATNCSSGGTRNDRRMSYPPP
jgi:hypothetical protein